MLINTVKKYKWTLVLKETSDTEHVAKSINVWSFNKTFQKY